MLKRLLILIQVLVVSGIYAQLAPPDVRCASVNLAGDVTLTYIIPADPLGQFTRYDVYSSFSQTGPYALVGNVTTYTQNSYTHVGASANIQGRYYYLVTISSGTVASVPSDTLRSIFLNLNNPGNGVAALSWNATHTPLLPSASTQYKLSREYPVGTWTQLYYGPGLSYKDTISMCRVYYSYLVETTDALGCTSQSNVPGGWLLDRTSPRIPDLDSITVNGNGSTTIGWQASASPDATGYVIYKNFAGVWTPIDTVYGINTTTYTYAASTAGNAPEQYCVAALDSCHNISPFDVAQTTMHLDTKYDVCSRSATLTWSAYGNLPHGVQDYQVYCSVNGRPYTYLSTTSSMTYVHDSLVPDTNYCYVVRVFNGDGSVTALSNRSCQIALGTSGPAYAYIRSASVNPAQDVDVTFAIDPSKPYRGVHMYRSEDGTSFSFLASYNGTSSTTYTDHNVSCGKHNYYYKLQVIDTCGNPGAQSNVAKTILLSVKNDPSQVFYNILNWDDYSSWLGNVSSYNIYRAVNGVFDPVPVGNVAFGFREYTDDVSAFVGGSGKFAYYVQAEEGAGNPYGFQDSSRSNISDAYAEATIFVPNSFVPKGRNKIWLPVAQYVEKTDYKVTVFNRWGSKVFETSSDTQGWDGANATDDVYAYLIQYKNARGEYTELKGIIMMVR